MSLSKCAISLTPGTSTSPGSINAYIRSQGYASRATVVHEEVQLVCKTCAALVTTFHAHLCDHKHLPKCVQMKNQVASRRLLKHRNAHATGEMATPRKRPRTEAPAGQTAVVTVNTTSEYTTPMASHSTSMIVVESDRARHVVQRTDLRTSASGRGVGESHAPNRTDRMLEIARQPAAGPGISGTDHRVSMPQPTHGGNHHLMPYLLHSEGMPVQLPCMMQLDFAHPVFGHHQVWAVLYWVDHEEATRQYVSKHQAMVAAEPAERFQYTDESTSNADRRCLYLHRVVHVTPLGSPFALLVNMPFSSLNASACRFGQQIRGLRAWHLMFQPQLTMADVIASSGFKNPDVRAAIQQIEKGPTPMADVVRRMELLSSRESYRDEPMLAMELIPNKQPRRGVAADDMEEDEEPDLTRTHHVPGWVPLRAESRTLREKCSMYQSVAGRGGVQDVTFRDCLAAMCENECNDLECDLPPEMDSDLPNRSHVSRAGKELTYTCPHGIQHSPYRADDVVEHTDADGNVVSTSHVEAMFLVPKNVVSRISRKTRSVMRNGEKVQEEIVKILAMPKRDPKTPRTAFESRIVFDQLHTLRSMDNVRRFAPMRLLKYVQCCLHQTRSSAFGEMMAYIERCSRTISTVADLDELDGMLFGGSRVWEPEQAELLMTPPRGTVPVVWRLKNDGALPTSIQQSLWPQSKGLASGNQSRLSGTPRAIQLHLTLDMMSLLRQRYPHRELRPVCRR